MSLDSTDKVIAVVVTYNRKVLLIECLKAILAQTFPVDKIILIDNASTDGTKAELESHEMLSNQCIDYRLMESNTGGAGGFYEGMKIARDEYGKSAWVWVMDDDTIPNPDCLEKILTANQIIKSKPVNSGIATAYKPSFYASAIYGADGEFMNVPSISNNPSPNGYPYWYHFLSDKMVNLSTATFVSLVIDMNAIKKCGLPCKDYFIWGDDTEYTMRLINYYGDAYLVGDSIAVHKRVGAMALDINLETNENRIKMFFYHRRNNAINARYYGEPKYKMYLRLLKHLLLGFIRIRSRIDWLRYKALLKGNFAAVTEYPKFKLYIDNELSGGINASAD